LRGCDRIGVREPAMFVSGPVPVSQLRINDLQYRGLGRGQNKQRRSR